MHTLYIILHNKYILCAYNNQCKIYKFTRAEKTVYYRGTPVICLEKYKMSSSDYNWSINQRGMKIMLILKLNN